MFKHSTVLGAAGEHRFLVTHNLGTLNVFVQPYKIATGAPVHPTLYFLRVLDKNTVEISFRGTPRTNSLRVVVIA